MKKHFLVLIAVVATIVGLSACTSFDEPLPQNTISDSHEAPLTISRTPEEAKACALEALGTFYGVSRSLSTTISDVICISRQSNSRSEATDTAMYIVNFTDSAGYALVSANRDVEPLLAITEKGSISDIDNIENASAQYVINRAQNIKWEVDTTKFVKYEPLKQIKVTESVSTSKTEPRAKLNWGQSWPEGIYCRNYTSGCSNTAAALAMSYFELPAKINLKYKGIVGLELDLDWEVIKQHKQSQSIFFGVNDILNFDHCSTNAHTMLAHLCRELGYRSNSMYFGNVNKGTTSTSVNNTYDTMKGLLPELNFSEMKQGKPSGANLGNGIIITWATGMNRKTNSKSVHMFVIDGYFKKTITNYTYNKWEYELEWTLVSTTSSTSTYNHINWGWNGYDNGYFLTDIFDTQRRTDIDGDETLSGNDLVYDDSFGYFIITK